MNIFSSKEMLAKLFGPALAENPQYLEKIQTAILTMYKKKVDRKIEKFIEKNNLDKKLKELELLSNNPVEGVVEAW